MPASVTLVISLAMNSSAFIAETIRGGLMSVDKGQKEAALSIGMSPIAMYMEIILPTGFYCSISVTWKFIHWYGQKYRNWFYNRCDRDAFAS